MHPYPIYPDPNELPVVQIWSRMVITGLSIFHSLRALSLF